MRIIIYSFILIICCSCRQSSERLEHAFQAAGDNRAELRKVVDHYSLDPRDSLKREAAMFLIENMPGHHTLNGPYLRGLRHKVDSATNSFLLGKVILMQPLRDPRILRQLRPEPDVEHITAEYLIHNIDEAFRQWTTYPWLEELTFDDFLEYLLPYRIGNEPLDYWRDSLPPRQKEHLQEAIAYFDDRKHSVYNMGQMIHGYALGMDDDSRQVAEIPYNASECVFSSQLQLLAYRSAGIPAVIDHVPAWADMNGFHEWALVIDPKNNDILGEQLEMKNAPKVFRRTYSANEIPMPETNEYIPPFFTSPYNRDVTDKYLRTRDVTVTPASPSHSGNTRHVYLAVFNGKNLRPVDWSRVKRGKAHFRKMGPGIVYFPLYFEGENPQYYSYPFILQANGNILPLLPDTTRLQTLKITRKYPLHHNKVYHGNALVGASFRAANDPTFRDTVRLHRVEHNPNMYPTVIPVDTTRTYRYWLFEHTKAVELAEWQIRDCRGRNITGKIIDPTGRGARLDALFDNNPLSYGRIDRRLIVDFGHPVSVSSIMYLPRNDANGIYPGNEYELFYFNLDGWQSLGCKIADSYEIEFENVPSNAIYWLRNHTTGNEERIFTISDGKQRFW